MIAILVAQLCSYEMRDVGCVQCAGLTRFFVLMLSRNLLDVPSSGFAFRMFTKVLLLEARMVQLAQL